MRHHVWIRTYLLCAALCTAAAPVSAEIVSHHQQLVEDDAMMETCIGCHDGLVSRNVQYCTINCGLFTSHPVLKPYPPEVRAGRRFASLTSVLRKGIRFEDGRISCISCHDLRNTKPPHLVMDNAGSRLCRTCHIW